MRFYCFFALLLATFTVSSPAFAVNQFYNHGFADGMIYQKQFCEQNALARTRFLAEENSRLKKELIALRQQTGHNTGLTTAAQIIPRQEESD